MPEIDFPTRGRYDHFVADEAAAHSGARYFEVHDSDLEHAPAPHADDDLVGYIHSAQLGTSVDGPGLRLVVFLTGCLLRCQYCHNPDTWHKRNGKPFTLGQAKQVLDRHAEVLRLSRGGLTLSGGEPMVQTAFMTQLFRHCKAIGVHTCLDTSGRLGDRLGDEQLMDIDLNLLDIKSGDPEVYRRVTGHPLQPTLDYAQRLSRLGRPMWIRYVLVPGLTDDHDNVERVADFTAGLGHVERVEILRFHQLGRSKWARLRLEYALASTAPPSAELTERVRDQFRRRGLTVF
jgi:pyruvate formate lyase activating enzyme